MTATWTTIHLARAALARGHAVRFFEPGDTEVFADGRLCVRTFAFDGQPRPADVMAKALQSRRVQRKLVAVDDLDLLFLRCAPLEPDIGWVAREARARGVEVINDPDGAQHVGNKTWLATRIGVVAPASRITSSLGEAFSFYPECPHGVVVKPARGSGGIGVSRVLPGQPAAFDIAFRAAQRASAKGRSEEEPGANAPVVIQAYLTEAEQGEKRVLWVDGHVPGAYLRLRAEGEFRHNLKCGGTAVPTEVTSAELVAVARVTPALLEAGIRFAGLDMIGSSITEVNALNPGGAYHTDRLGGSDVAGQIIEHFVGTAGSRRAARGLRTEWQPCAP